MIALGILLASGLVGFSFLRLLSIKVHGSEVVSLSYILGFFISTWLIFGAVAVLGYTVGIISFFVAGGVLGAFLFLQRKNLWGRLELWKDGGWNWLIFLVFWSVILLPLFSSHLFFEKDSGLYSGGSAWGDLAIHASLLHKFAFQNSLDLTSPIYAAEQTNYPFFIDFYAGILHRTGLSLQLSLFTTSFILLLATLNILYFSLLKQTKKTLVPWLTTLLFMGSGGWGFSYLWQDLQASNLSIKDFFLALPNYAHLFEHGYEWSNFVTDYLLPQRGYVMGLAVFVIIFRLLADYWHKKNHNLWWSGAVLIGLLPLFHTHTFITLFGIYLCFGVWNVLKKKMTFTQYLLGIGIIGLLGFPQLYWQFSQTPNNQSFLKFNWGWMKQPEDWFLLFWLKNMGIGFIAMVFGSAYFIWKERKQEFISVFLVPLLILFALCNLFLFQPFAFDNMKFMLYTYLLVCVVTSYILEKWWHKGWQPVVILVVFLMTLSGILSIFREYTLSWQIASREDLRIAEEIKQKTDPAGIFLTADTHTHPAVMLAGRSTVLGYRGWLWSHGIAYQATEEEVRQIYTGSASALELLKKHHVTYIYLSTLEENQYAVNLPFFEKNFEEIISLPNGRVFKTAIE